MAAGRWKLYNAAKLAIADGTLDLDDTADWKVALFVSTSNANDLTQETFGDLTNEHAAANGYAPGGVAVAGQTWTQTDGVATFDSEDAEWMAAGGELRARFAVYYKDATVNGVVKPLLCVSLLNTAPADVVSSDGNPLIVAMHASGIFSLTGAMVD